MRLQSGMELPLARHDLYRFSESEEVLLLLTFLASSDNLDDGLLSEATKERVQASAAEICEAHVKPFIAKGLAFFPGVEFALVGIRIQVPTEEKTGVQQFVNWTTVHRLEDQDFGRPINEDFGEGR